MTCSQCGSVSKTRYGKDRKKRQRYQCSTCKHVYIYNKGFLRMRYPARIIETSWLLYYQGLSFRKVTQHLKLKKRIQPHHTTIYRWILKYNNILNTYLSKKRINNSPVLCADEIRLDFKNKENWCFDAIDFETRFWIASEMTHRRRKQHAVALFEECKAKSKKRPQRIITDNLKAYPNSIKQVYGGGISKPPLHITMGITEYNKHRHHVHNNRMERMQGTVRERYKVMRGFSQLHSAQNLITGLMIYYNFFKPHMGIKNKTPAQTAGIGLAWPYSWRQLVNTAANAA